MSWSRVYFLPYRHTIFTYSGFSRSQAVFSLIARYAIFIVLAFLSSFHYRLHFGGLSCQPKVSLHRVSEVFFSFFIVQRIVHAISMEQPRIYNTGYTPFVKHNLIDLVTSCSNRRQTNSSLNLLDVNSSAEDNNISGEPKLHFIWLLAELFRAQKILEIVQINNDKMPSVDSNII